MQITKKTLSMNYSKKDKMKFNKPIRLLRNFLIFLVLSSFIFSACTKVKYLKPGYIQTGKASWYGPGFHGKKTSSREIYNMHDMTAAHRTLPFGTYVFVTNLINNKTITVKINDRGPFVKGRIIDLSYAAALSLDMVGPGVIPVRIEAIQERSPNLHPPTFTVQAGAFTKKSNAKDLKKHLIKFLPGVYLSKFKTSHQIYYRVRIKSKNRQEAKKIIINLKKRGFNGFILEEK